MCKAIRQIKQSAYAEGKQSGFAEGKQSGFAEGIRKTVSILKSLQVGMEQIQAKLMEEYSLTADEASKYLL